MTTAGPDFDVPGAGAGRRQQFLAAGMIIAAMVSFALQDLVVKVTASDVSIWQMQAVRSVAVLILLTSVLVAIGRMREMTPRRLFWPLARAGLMTGAYLFFYASLPYLTLANAASVFFIGPLLITVLAAILLGEPIGPRRVIAVILGFAGVLLIIRPGSEGWTPVAVMPAIAAACYALAIVLTRWRCRDDPGFALTAVHNMLYAGIGLAGIALMPLMPLPEAFRTENAFLTAGWLPLSTTVLALLVLTAFTHITGLLLSIRAYKEVEASQLAPFEYSYLVIMGALDYLIWRTVPDQMAFAGMALICGAGMFIAWREGRPARPRMQQQTEVPWTRDGEDGTPGA
ncbi:MAG: DMT family transporter [Pseudomonadota bacterium]